MKATELMIYDWVYIREYPMRQEAKQMMEDYFFRSLCEFEPIPLTEEILKANGFTIRRDAYYLSCGFLGNDWERSGIEIKFYNRAVIDIECNYLKHTNRVHLVADSVHELQHALRLCGLNKLADNFKI